MDKMTRFAASFAGFLVALRLPIPQGIGSVATLPTSIELTRKRNIGTAVFQQLHNVDSVSIISIANF